MRERSTSLIFCIYYWWTMFNITFIVNFTWLTYFQKKLSKKTNIEVILKDSWILKNELEEMYWLHKNQLYEIITFFSIPDNFDFRVEVYPMYYYIWAVNVYRRVILLWQPKHSQHHYLALIVHEITHCLLSEKKLERIIEEILCFLFEFKTLQEIDWIDLEDISYTVNIDDFHRKAIWYAKECFTDFLDYFQKKDYDNLIDFVKNKVNSDDLKLNIPTNISSYLQGFNE